MSDVPLTVIADGLSETADHLRDYPDQWACGDLYFTGYGKRTSDKRRAHKACALGRLSIITGIPVRIICKELGHDADKITSVNDSTSRAETIRFLRRLARKYRRRDADA